MKRNIKPVKTVINSSLRPCYTLHKIDITNVTSNVMYITIYHVTRASFCSNRMEFLKNLQIMQNKIIHV